MNTLVSFELTKLLKEKGFDEWTTTWHQRGEGIVGCVEGRRDYYNRKGEVYTSAPTIAEVVMWLYEKHGVWIYLVPAEDNKDVFKPFFRGKNIIDQHLTEFFNSPTEAYEAGIEYTLNNLI